MNTPRRSLFAGQGAMRVLLVLAAVAAVFVASYSYASARRAPASTAVASDSYAAYGASGGALTDGGACACCGGSTEEIEGTTTLDGDVQKIGIATDNGYNPNVVRARAGIPIELTFARGDGCYAEIVFPGFGVYEDLTQGPVTVALPALEPGTYGWSCGMQMAYGAIVVE